MLGRLLLLVFAFNMLAVSVIAVEPRPRMPDALCQSVKQWKELMRKENPTADRSVPGAAKSCMIADD